MCSTRKSSLTAVALAAMAWLAANALAADAPAATPAAATTGPATLAMLRAERIDVIGRLLRNATEHWPAGRADAEPDVTRYRRMLLDVVLEAADSPERRVALLRAEVDAARSAEERARLLHERSLRTSGALLEARAYRLDAEIRLAKEDGPTSRPAA